MNKQRLVIAILAILLLSIIRISPAQAQGGGWSEPYRLSSTAGASSAASLVADQYGYVHCFWSEALFAERQTIIQYARFDGGTWSAPNDIYLTTGAIDHLSPDVDDNGTLHIIWVEPMLGANGPVYYTHAPASSALSAQSWAKPVRINIQAGIVRFQVDSNGVFHILYIDRGQAIGVFYVRSEDHGQTWSEPVWLDPDIPPGHTPDSLNFELDENDGLHAVWYYGALDRDAEPNWVRYIHSLDGGKTWSSPFMIDQRIEDTEHNLTAAGPIMTVQGQTVHVIWAAGTLPYRNYRFSKDAGQTWSQPRRIFGELHGQASDGLAVDGAGRVHFFGQIRYPLGIYEAYWDHSRWSQPSLVYFIAQRNFDEELGDTIHAHEVRPVVRDGNQLVVTFADPPADPNRRLFVTYRTMDDVSPLETIPTPMPAATLILPPSPTARPTRPAPTVMATAAPINTAGVDPVDAAPKVDLALQVGIVPVLLLLGGTIVFRLWYKHKP